MSLRDSLLPLVDTIRNIPGALGLRRYQVWVRLRVWSGSRPGLGTPTLTDTRVLVGGIDPKVVVAESEDVIAGSTDEVLFDIGPISPEYVGGGVLPNTLAPAQTGSATEIVYLLKGPGLPAAGEECTPIDTRFEKSFRYMVRVRSKGRAG